MQLVLKSRMIKYMSLDSGNSRIGHLQESSKMSVLVDLKLTGYAK